MGDWEGVEDVVCHSDAVYLHAEADIVDGLEASDELSVWVEHAPADGESNWFGLFDGLVFTLTGKIAVFLFDEAFVGFFCEWDLRLFGHDDEWFNQVDFPFFLATNDVYLVNAEFAELAIFEQTFGVWDLQRKNVVLNIFLVVLNIWI